MFVDDLVVVTTASWAIVKACKNFLVIYSDLTEQTPNMNKSSIYFPSWLNKRVRRPIGGILGME